MHSFELMQATELAPFSDDEIAFGVDRTAVRRVANSFSPLVLGQPEITPVFFVRIVAELGGDGAILVQQSDSALEFRHKGVTIANVNGRRHAQVLLNDADEISLEIP